MDQNLAHKAYSYLEDPAVPDFDGGPIFTVMDAKCALCAKGAAWIARHDKTEQFKIIPLQSNLGRALLTHYNLDPDDPISWLYLQEGVAYTSLDAFIRVGNRLGGINKTLNILHLIPKTLQDKLYRLIAQNRYKLFGTADMCTLPNAEVQKRLIQEAPH